MVNLAAHRSLLGVMTACPLQPEALFCAAEEVNRTSERGLENDLARISIAVAETLPTDTRLPTSKVYRADAAAGPKLPDRA